MRETIAELNDIIESFSKKLADIPEEEFSEKSRPEKWSKKEVIGHLIDSAQNNLRRFIVGQYDESAFIVYNQDFWVNANAYNQMDQREIIALWRLINRRILAVLSEMPSEKYSHRLSTSKDSVQTNSLQWLASDYVKHMKHHLNQVFNNAFDVVYP